MIDGNTLRKEFVGLTGGGGGGVAASVGGVSDKTSLTFYLGMIFSENRSPLFGIMPLVCP